jgi:hypothetical protein
MQTSQVPLPSSFRRWSRNRYLPELPKEADALLMFIAVAASSSLTLTPVQTPELFCTSVGFDSTLVIGQNIPVRTVKMRREQHVGKDRRTKTTTTDTLCTSSSTWTTKLERYSYEVMLHGHTGTCFIIIVILQS